jgi:hypothetical protein
MHEGGFDQYGKKMLDSVKQHWGEGLHLTCFYHDFDITTKDAPQSPNITYRNLNEITEMLEYRDAFAKYDGNYSAGYNWRMDAIKWCHKVFALSEYAFELSDDSREAGWMVWIDADTVTDTPFTFTDIEEYLPQKASIVHLGRTTTDYSETSFIGFNLDRENPLQLIADLRGAYISGEVLGYREWHDGFIFERLLNIYKAHGTNVYNLTPKVEDLDAFGVSPLSQWMTHFKGNKKQLLNDTTVAPDVNGPARYQQLLDVVKHYRVESVIETGCWNGGRAIQMALTAFDSGRDEFTYTGYDLFEEATEESDEREMNSKAHNTLTAITNRLTEFKEAAEEDGKTFNFTLHKGDTNETLKGDESADLVYIDGGHSYDTTLNDYNKVTAPIIVFDDFFTEDTDGNKPIEEHCGTNKVIEGIIEDIKEVDLDWRVKVLPSSDRVREGGHTHLAVVLKDPELEELPKEFSRVPIVVTPKDCMPDDYIINNVNTNIENVDGGDWIEECKLTEDHMIIVSGGQIDYESLRLTIKNLESNGKNPKVACVKHSYPRLLKHKIVPDYCIILDPRPIDGVSTHGVVRKELFKKINKDTLFLVASMTDPSVVEYLQSKDATIKLWHAFSDAIRDKDEKGEFKINPNCNIPEGSVFVTGGTCAAMRTFGMFHVLGFRTFHFFGFDCSVPEEDITDEMKEEKLDTGHQKYFKVESDDQVFWTTGELLAMAQDCEKLFDRQDIDFSLCFHGGPSLVKSVYETSKKVNENTYEEII